MFAHDVKLFFGDMNFKSEVYDFDWCTKNIATQNYTELLKKDEFYVHRDKDPLLKTLTEGLVNFAPTYKYICVTNNYDRTNMPSYSDRVLFATKQPNQLK